jgi:hypothetical protein
VVDGEVRLVADGDYSSPAGGWSHAGDEVGKQRRHRVMWLQEDGSVPRDLGRQRRCEWPAWAATTGLEEGELRGKKQEERIGRGEVAEVVERGGGGGHAGEEAQNEYGFGF